MNLEFSHRLFFQSMKTKNNPYIKKVNISVKDIQNIYRNIYLVNADETFTNILSDNNVIIQTPQQVNFNQPVLDLFLNARFGQQIVPMHILDKLNKNWIFYQTYKKKSLEKNIPIYVFTIDFLTGLEMYDVFKYLNINYIKYKKREQVAKEFLNHCVGSLGFLSVNQNFILMIFHNAVNKKTIAHQLCHYFQEIIGVYQSQVVNIDSA